MYAIYGNIYHQYTPVMLAYIPYMDPMGNGLVWPTNFNQLLWVHISDCHRDRRTALKWFKMTIRLWSGRWPNPQLFPAYWLANHDWSKWVKVHLPPALTAVVTDWPWKCCKGILLLEAEMDCQNQWLLRSPQGMFWEPRNCRTYENSWTWLTWLWPHCPKQIPCGKQT